MKEFDLKTLGLADGDYEITVVARANGYKNSPPSNAISYVVGSGEEQNYTLSGVWTFKDVLTLEDSKADLIFTDYDFPTEILVNFNCNGVSYNKIKLYYQLGIAYKFYKMAYINDTVKNSTIYQKYDTGKMSFYWVQDYYKTIDFGETPQTVSKEFYEWFTVNAVKQEETQGYTVSVDATEKYNDGLVIETFVDIYDGNGLNSSTLVAQNVSEWSGTITSGYVSIVSENHGIEISGNCEIIYNEKYDEPDFLTIFKIMGDCSISISPPCFAEGTQITLANGNTKAVEDITYDDELLVWDFYNGEYAVAKPTWIKIEQTAHYYHKIILSNGIVMRLVGKKGHRLFSVDEQKMLYSNEIVGHRVYTLDGIATVISCETIKEKVKFYNLTTEKHLNCFADNVLTGSRLNNMYHITDMKYDSDIRLISEEEEAERWAVRERLRK